MAETNLKKNKNGYGYKYTDLAEIHNYLEDNNMRYIQTIKRIETDDYIMTKRYIDGKWEDEWLQGSKVVDATLQGIKNPAQEQGSALTYARRYSLLMAFGLATEDDDANSLSRNKTTNTSTENQNKVTPAVTSNQLNVLNKMSDSNKQKVYEKYNVSKLEELNVLQASEIIGLLNKGGNKQ